MLSFTQPLKGMAEFEEIEKSLEKNQYWKKKQQEEN